MAGEMNSNPNALQRIFHRFLSLPSIAPKMHRVDQAILKLTKGKFTRYNSWLEYYSAHDDWCKNKTAPYAAAYCFV
jgi:hypothetical protein